MKRLAIVDMNGRVSGYTSVPEDQIEANRRNRLEHDLIEELPPSSHHIWDGAKWNEPPDGNDLKVLKDQKLASLKTWRHVQENKGFTWNDKLFESDPESRTSITLAVLVGEQRTWHSADNTIVNLSVDDLKSFGRALSSFMDDIHKRYQFLKSQINGVKKAEEFDNNAGLHFMPHVSLD